MVDVNRGQVINPRESAQSAEKGDQRETEENRGLRRWAQIFE